MDQDRIKGMGREAVGQAQGGLGELTGDRGMQVEGAAREYAGQTEQAAGRAKDAIRDVVNDASDRMGDAYAQGTAYVRQNAEGMGSLVRDYPLGSFAIAAAIGYLFALVVHGRR